MFSTIRCPSHHGMTAIQRLRHSPTRPTSTSAMASVTTGVVLPPSEAEARCDNKKTAGPLVQHDGEKYLMWYYCQGTTTHEPSGILPLGDIALATSADGFNWERQEGPLPGGAVMSPRFDDPTAFDSGLLGCSCVLRVGDKWHIYFSGGLGAISTLPVGKAPGFPMRGGLATSTDGINWDRVHGSGVGGSILDIGATGDHDAEYIGWPSVVQLAPDSFVMIYHSAVFNITPQGGISPQWSLARAVSTDGVEWNKSGLCEILDREESPDAFDSKGLGTRDVVVMDSGEFLMLVEGVNDSGKHQIAVMRSLDQGRTWSVGNDGKPVLSAPGEGSVGTACIVRPDGADSDVWWLYCVLASEGSFSIGLAISSSGPEGPFLWHVA